MTQNKQILHYLKTGKSLTPLEALYQFGCLRLSARIYDLKKNGWPIACDLQDVGDGKKVGYYTLVNNRELWPT